MQVLLSHALKLHCGCCCRSEGVLWALRLQLLVKSTGTCRKADTQKNLPVVQNHWHVTEKENYCTSIEPPRWRFCTNGCIIPVWNHPAAANWTDFIENREANAGVIIMLSPTCKEMYVISLRVNSAFWRFSLSVCFLEWLFSQVCLYRTAPVAFTFL